MTKKILRLAIPSIISTLSVPLLSSVDTAVVGHLDKVEYLGAIALGSMIFNFIYMTFSFLRMGTKGLTAQANGKMDEEMINMILQRALAVALGSAIILIIAQNWIAELSLAIIGGSSEVERLAGEYFYIRIWAAPASLALYVFNGWFLGLQNAKIPLIITVTLNILNIFFNLLFIYQFDMNSNGVALGTVFAQYIGLIMAIVFTYRKYGEKLTPVAFGKLFERKELAKFFKINVDIFIRTVLLIFALSFFTTKSAGFGDNLLAANTILMQLWMIISYGIDGFAYASESLVGKYYGAKNSEKLKRVVKETFLWAAGISVVFMVTYLLASKEILGIFTDKTDIIELAMSFMGWILISPLLNSSAFIWDGIFVGATASKAMRNSMIVSTIFVYFPVYYISEGVIGNHSLWLALTLFMVSRGITLAAYSRRYIFETPMK